MRIGVALLCLLGLPGPAEAQRLFIKSYTQNDGLPAAQVMKVEKDRMKPLFYAVEARPFVNLGRLEHIEILVPTRRP